MLYIDKNPMPGPGNSKLWRVFASDTVALRAALRSAGGKVDIKASGTPGEHAVVTTTVKNKLRAEEADMRTLVKLIKAKRRLSEIEAIPEESIDTSDIPEQNEEAFARARRTHWVTGYDKFEDEGFDDCDADGDADEAKDD